MKTWEVLKNLDEYTTKRYRRLGDGLEMSRGGQLGMYYQWKSGHAHLSPLDEWEEAPREVPWYEAIEAWVNGKEIMLVTNDGDKYIQRDGFKFGAKQNQKGVVSLSGYSSEDFAKGKWYIL